MTSTSFDAPGAEPPSAGRRRRWVVVIAVAVVVLAAAGGLGAWWYLRDDSPSAVSLDAAVGQVDGADPGAAADGAGSAEPTIEDIDGTWTVDTETGELDFESATGSFVGFRVEEELRGLGSTTAVGRTGEVTGRIQIADGMLTAASFEADMASITTNDQRRDNRVRSALETDQFPSATFELTSPIELPADAADGEAVTVTAEGGLTIHGVAQPVAFPLRAQLVGDTVVVVGSLDIVFADFGVETPDSQIVLSVEDNGILELQLLFRKG